MSIHSCSYYCERPKCIKRQRDELVKEMEAREAVDGRYDERTAAPIAQTDDARDAARYRWLRDETIQDSRAIPFGIAIYSKRADTGAPCWAVTYDVDADAAIDAAIQGDET